MAQIVEQAVDETDLIRKAQQGDRTAFASVIELHYDSLHRWLTQMTRDAHLAEDLVQETFLKAFANLCKFTPGTNLRAWLFRIAHNNLINQYRGNRSRREALSENLVEKNAPDPLGELEQKEAVATIARAVAQLPEDYRAPFLLRVDQDLSFRQIAQIMKLTEETARWRVFKARQLLMKELTPGQEQERT